MSNFILKVLSPWKIVSSSPLLEAIRFIHDLLLLVFRYVITLLVNLNARSSRQPKTESIIGANARHISTMAFAPGQTPAASGTNASSSSRIMSLIYSVIRTARHDTTVV